MGYVTVVTSTPPTGVSVNQGNIGTYSSPGFSTNTSIPAVVDYTPTNIETADSLLPDITIKFNLPMVIGQYVQSGDINGATVLANNSIILANADLTAPTDATYQVEVVSYDTYTDTLTIKPTTALEYGTQYSLTVLAGMVDTAGRKIPRSITWLFSTTSSELAVPTLTSPLDQEVRATSPACLWTCATTGVTFDFQIASSPAFSTLTYSTTGLSATTIGPFAPELILDSTTYYWRVRAVSGSLDSDWSLASAFRVEAPASVPVVRTLPTFDTFAVVAQLPRAGKGNFTDWPTCAITFNDAVYEASVPSGVVLTANDVDTGASVTASAFTTGMSGNTLTITFTDTISANTRYTLTLDSIMSSAGSILSAPQEITFTSAYTPMYVDYSALLSSQGTYGAFFARYSQEEINRQLHRASIKCNRLILGSEVTELGSLRTNLDVTYDMTEYVMALTSYTLIQDFQFKLLTEADRKTQIDTLVDSLGTDILKQISAILKQLKGEVDTHAISIAGTIVKPVSGVRSSEWDPASMEDDLSVAGLLKGNF